jgi:hypothetical protein
MQQRQYVIAQGRRFRGRATGCGQLGLNPAVAILQYGLGGVMIVVEQHCGSCHVCSTEMNISHRRSMFKQFKYNDD